ncbi:MAG: hypothetical protein ACF8PG_13305 [Maioricimonas sp. JB045]|uniref:SPW repeat domain-containing protein n=1 Tax=Maioricimonas sp. JC845 TaxID=3232138 RepID=UPI0034575660
MWSRVVEIMLGCWLVISPFIFAHPDTELTWWISDMLCGTAVILFGLLSYWRPARRAHLATIGVAIWLIAYAYLRSSEATGAAIQNAAIQNNMALGLLLMMFAIIPNDASKPPEPWRVPTGDTTRSGSSPQEPDDLPQSGTDRQLAASHH